MVVQDLLKDVSERLTTNTKVGAAFGEPHTVGNKTIIPIAAVGVGFGAGGGECNAPQNDGQECEKQSGGGGGGGGGAKPLAVLEVTDKSTRMIPVIDMTRVIVASIMFAASAVFMVTKLLEKNSKNK